MQYALRPQNCGYQRREPEPGLLHSVLLEHLETFLSDVRSDMYALPRHVENELREYLRCGVLAYGFVRMRMVAALTDPVSIRNYLDGVGLPSEIPQIRPARPPPQMELEYEEIDYHSER